MVYKIAKKHLAGFIGWLDSLGGLSAYDNRERVEFSTMLNESVEQFKKDREALFESHVQKDENGKNIEIEGDPQMKDKEAYEKEAVALSNSEAEFPIEDDDVEFFKHLKKLVLETEYKFGPSYGDSTAEKFRKIVESKGYHEWAKTFDNLEL